MTEPGLEPYADVMVIVYGQVLTSRGNTLPQAQALRSAWLKAAGFKAHGQPLPSDCTLFFTFEQRGESTTVYIPDISVFRIVEHGAGGQGG